MLIADLDLALATGLLAYGMLKKINMTLNSSEEEHYAVHIDVGTTSVF